MQLLLSLLLTLCYSAELVNLKSKFSDTAINPILEEDVVKITPHSKCYRFKVSQGDCYESSEWSDCDTFRERAELVDNRVAPLNTETNYKFSILIPHGYQNLAVKQIMGQWHNGVYGPSLSIRHLNGVFWLDLMLEDNKTTQKFFLPKLEPGVWNTFSFSITWANSDEGRIELFMNSKRVVNYSGHTLGSGLGQGPYFRFGLYRSHLYRIRAATWPTQSAFYCNIEPLN